MNISVEKSAILIVEDEVVQAKNISSLLKNNNYAIAGIAASGEKALQLIEQELPDLILMDIRLKGKLDGIKTTDVFQKKYDIPVIFITAYADKETIKRATQTTPHGFITKPIDEAQLIGSIETTLYKCRFEQALKESEAWLHTTVNSINQGIIALELNGKIRFANPAAHKLVADSNKPIVGLHLGDLMHLEGVEARSFTQDLIDKALKGERKSEYISEFYLTDPDRKKIPIELKALPIRKQGNQILGLAVILSDVTERKQAVEREKQMMETEKLAALGTLISGIAHEINNPNHFILLNIPLLEGVWNDILPILDHYHQEKGDFDIGGSSYSEMRAEFQEICQYIKSGASKIKKIVNDLKQFSKRATNNYQEDVDLNKVVRSATTLLNNKIKKATDRFAVDLDEDLPIFKGNTQQLEQVIINLIQNSCDALTSKKQSIRVKTVFYSEPEYIELEVIDKGCGIDKKDFSKIFDHFYTTKREQGGTGLGLSISKQIIERHQGTFAIDSKSGKGTTVTCRLPLPDGQ